MNKSLIGLFIYILIFVIMLCIIGNLMTFFYSNLSVIKSDINTSSDFSILNLYFLKITKLRNIKIKNYGVADDDSSYYITFIKEDGNTDTFIKKDKIIYLNKVKMCENVDVFKVFVDKSEKEKISIEVKILDKLYNSQYVIEE